MSACDGEHGNADLHARSNYHSSFYSLFDARICTTSIAHAGYPGINRPPHILNGIEKTHRERSDHIAGDIHTLEHQMDMGVNETWQDGPAARVDFVDRFIGQAEAIRAADSLDTIVLNQDGGVGYWRTAGTINQRAIANECVDGDYPFMLGLAVSSIALMTKRSLEAGENSMEKAIRSGIYCQ